MDFTKCVEGAQKLCINTMRKYAERQSKRRKEGEEEQPQTQRQIRCYPLPKTKQTQAHALTHQHTHTDRQARSLTFCSILLGSKNRESRRRKRTNQYKENIDAEKSLPNA